MKMKNVVYLIVVALLLIATRAEAQDSHFSQFYANPVYLNPALAGSAVCPRIVVNYRHQWPSVSGKYTTYSASYDQHFNALHGGIGVLFLGDRAANGTINTNAISLIYSFHANLSRKVSMRLGIQATYQQKSLNYDKCTFGDMIDARYGFTYATAEQIAHQTKGLADFSAGLVIYSDKVYGGIAVNHFTQPKESFYDSDGAECRLPMKLTAHVGGNINLKSRLKHQKSFGDMSLSPNLIFQYQTKFSGGHAYTTLNYGLYFSCYPMVVGAWFRQGFQNVDALIFLVGIHYKFLKIGYSYDFTLPSKKYVKPATGGAHEISAQFDLPCPVKSRRIRNINCPKF